MSINWSTSLFQCFEDEESCWWSFWCYPLIASRNIQTFGVGKGLHYLWIFLLVFAGFFYTCISPDTFKFRLAFIGLGLSVFIRGRFRGLIRERYNIRSEFCGCIADYLVHYCCAPCAVAQESREAKLLNKPFSDYITDQPLDEIYSTEEDLLLLSRNSSHFGNDSSLPTQRQRKVDPMIVSKASRLLIFIFGLLFVSSLTYVGLKDPLHILTFFLCYVQSIVVLYVMYWKERKEYACLDYVVKSFFVGTTVTVFQAMMIFFVFYFLSTFVLIVTLYLTNPYTIQVRSEEGETQDIISPLVDIAISQTTFLFDKGNFNPNLFANVVNAHGYEERPTSQLFANFGNSTFTGILRPFPDTIVENNVIIFSIFIFISCLAIAATTEVCKYMIFRGCKMPFIVTHPSAILVYLLTGALGYSSGLAVINELFFSVAENDIVSWRSLFQWNFIWWKLIYHLGRFLVPVDITCALYQAYNTSLVRINDFLFSFDSLIVSFG